MRNRSLIWALAALVLASCNTADVEKINLKDDHVLTASIENPTRTVVETDGTKVLWNAGENISVFLNGTNYKFTSKNTSQAATANFEGTPSLSGVSDSNPILALSPYKSGSKVVSGIIYYNLPASQQAVENTYDPNAHALVAYSTNTDVSFYNVTSGIRFTLKQSGITDITLKSNNAEALAGDLQIKASVTTPTIQNITSASTTIKLLPPAGGFKTGVWYYITTIPVKLTKGFTIDFKAGALAASFTTSSVVTMKRGGYGSIAEIDRNLTFQDPTVHVESITVDPTSMKLAPSETGTITATVLPENATDKSIKWSSSNETVATVDQTGKVTAKAAGTTVIVALTNDGYKTATCNVTVVPPVSDMRTQYAESSSGYQTFGKVIHYKYGTKYGSTQNEFYVVPWGNDKALEDTDAAHFTATSSKTDVVTVNVVKVDNSCVFQVKVVNNPGSMEKSFSNLTFTYTAAGGTKLTKTTRLVVANSSATSAFTYEYYSNYYPTSSSTTHPDINGGSFTATLTNATYTPSMRSYPKFKGNPSSVGVAETKDMATYSFTSSNTSVVTVQSGTGPEANGAFTYAEMFFKSIGKSDVVLKYTDYKGNTLNKTINVTVNKNFLASSDYIDYSSTKSNNSSSNRFFLPVNSGLGLYVRQSSGTAYGVNDLVDITWSTSNSSYATISPSAAQGERYIMVSGKAPGDVTITAKGKDGSTKYFYITVYKPVTGITPNSTTFKLGLGTSHTMNYSGEDYTVVPSDATYKNASDFKWKSLNTNYVAVSGEIITGNGVGTTTVQAAPKPNYDTYYEARKVQVVDYRLKVTSSNSYTAPTNKLYANSDVITMEVGSTITVCYASTSGSSYTWNGTCNFSSSSTVSTSVATVGYANQYAEIKAKGTGTTYVDLDYNGSNGRIYKRYQVKVVPKFTWASGDIASNSASERPKTSPYWLTTDQTVTVYAYHGSSQYTASQAAALTWKSSNTNYATVSPSVGNSTVVTPKSTGLVEIIGTDSYGNTRSCWVQVYVPVTAIKGNSTPFYIGMGMSNFTHQMTYGSQADYTVTPSNATYTSPDHFRWSSSDESVATVGQQTGLVSFGTAPSSEKSAILKAIPSPNGKNVATTNVRTFQYVYWETYCYSSQDGGITSGKSFTGTSSNNVTVKKGSMSYLYIRSRTDSSSGQINFRNATYSITSSNTSVCKVNAYNPGTNNYVWISGSSTGTSNVVISINDGGHYFRMPFTVTVTD